MDQSEAHDLESASVFTVTIVVVCRLAIGGVTDRLGAELYKPPVPVGVGL
jgi:hypothetical protein